MKQLRAGENTEHSEWDAKIVPGKEAGYGKRNATRQ
jgi:hypothetical protein